MARQVINIGSAVNDGTGDPLRTAGGKINDNFAEVYGQVKHLSHYMITGESNPSHNAFVRLAAALVDGDTVYIDAGTHTLLSQITISGKNGLTFRLSRAARIRLTNRAWNVDGARVGIAFEDCNDLTIDGGVWDGNGSLNNPLNSDQFSILAIVSNVAVTTSTIQSRRILVRNAQFTASARTALSLRNTEDVAVENCSFDCGTTTVGSNCALLGLAMAHRTRVLRCTFTGISTTANPIDHGGIIVSPGQGLGASIYTTMVNGGKLDPFGNSAHFEWTAPASGTTATVSWASLGVFAANFDYTKMKFLHLCKNRNGKYDISPGRLICTGMDNTAKTITFALRNLIGATTNPVPAFAGQTMVTWGYRPDQMVKDLVVEGCYFKRLGAGIFLWGVDGYVFTGNHCLDNRDIALDAEMSVNGVISNNVCQSSADHVRQNSAISVLELAHNVAITGNTIRCHNGLYGIDIETGGPIISNVTVSGNTIIGGDIRLRGGGQTQTGCNIGYVNIAGNTIDAKQVDGGAAFGANIQIDTVNVCRDINISSNNLLNAASAPIGFIAVDGLTITNNNITHTQWNGIAQEAAVSNVNTSRRVVIANNYLHDIGQGWRDGFGLLRRLGTTSTEAARIYGNHITTAATNVDYTLNTPILTVNDAAVPPTGIPTVQIGTIMLRDNAGALEKSTNAPHGGSGTWTAV